MTTSTSVMNAFDAASGSSSSIVHDVVVVVLGGLMLIWVTWAIAGIGTRYLEKLEGSRTALWYAVRALVLVIVVVFYLLR